MKIVYLQAVFVFSFVLFTSNVGFAQVDGSNSTQQSSQKFDKKLLKYYSQADLEDLLNSSPEKYNVISYYYLSSYLLIVTDPGNPYLTSFDMENFDISKYESRRGLTEEVELNFDKYGVKLILLPYDQLLYLTPIQVEMREKLENE